MPRGPQIDAPETLHHVMVRGIERRRIFESDRDREDFLDRLGRIIQEGGADRKTAIGGATNESRGYSFCFRARGGICKRKQ